MVSPNLGFISGNISVKVRGQEGIGVQQEYSALEVPRPAPYFKATKFFNKTLASITKGDEDHTYVVDQVYNNVVASKAAVGCQMEVDHIVYDPARGYLPNGVDIDFCWIVWGLEPHYSCPGCVTFWEKDDVFEMQ